MKSENNYHSIPYFINATCNIHFNGRWGKFTL